MSSKPPEIYPLRLRVAFAKSKSRSYAVVPGLRQLTKRRILGRAGHLADAVRLDAVGLGLPREKTLATLTAT